jgi:hypothetical protein
MGMPAYQLGLVALVTLVASLELYYEFGAHPPHSPVKLQNSFLLASDYAEWH